MPARAEESREDKPCRRGLLVCVLVRALRMPSGEMSTLDRILASGLDVGAPLGGARGFEGVWLDGVVGVPGEGRDTGLTPVLFITLVMLLRMELIFPRSTLAKFICRAAGLGGTGVVGVGAADDGGI